MEWIFTDWQPMLMVLISAICMYGALVFLTRFGGLRSFSKMSGFDFAITVSIGSIFASVILAKTPPLLLGVWALFCVFALQISFAALRKLSDSIESISSNKPRLIMAGKAMQPDQMQKAKITEADLRAKLREANVTSYDQIIAVVAETTGDVSVLHSKDGIAGFDPDLLKDVIGSSRLIGNPVD